MTNEDHDRTVQRTQWTDSLLEDLCVALRGARDDDTVRAFARELMDDKDLPLSYLVRKVRKRVGASEADRLDRLIRGHRAVEQSKAGGAGGVRGLLRRFLR